ncbi:hypothetical protein BJV78DRAFT_1246515 [Lactifluus subvellereus]|nr:hypothetical protein BJV78DRAFT_1246515 [Lactifluus subvellereus]
MGFSLPFKRASTVVYLHVCVSVLGCDSADTMAEGCTRGPEEVEGEYGLESKDCQRNGDVGRVRTLGAWLQVDSDLKLNEGVVASRNCSGPSGAQCGRSEFPELHERDSLALGVAMRTSGNCSGPSGARCRSEFSRFR